MMMKMGVAFFPAIVGIVLLLGTCANILSPPKDRDTIPPGKGRLALSVESPRTALPPGTFDKYVLRFVHGGTEGYTHENVEWSAGLTVDLEPGAWTVDLDAYVGTAVSGTGSAAVTVGAGTVTPVTITIGVNTGAGVKGTLKHKTSYPTADANHIYGTQTLTVRDEVGNVVGSPVTITNGAEGSLALDPGVYFVSVVIEDTIQRTGVARTSAAHIYGGKETSLEFVIEEEDFTVLVPLIVTAGLTVPSNVTVGSRQVSAYSDASCTSNLGTELTTALTGPVELILWAPSASTAVYVRQEITIGGVTLNGGIETVNITNPEQAVIAGLNDTAYEVSIATGIANGTVTADKSVVFPDNPITLTVTPDSGYVLKSGSLQYSYGGNDYPITGATFVMPASNVTISAFFNKSIGFAIEGPQDKMVTVTLEHSADHTPPTEISWSGNETITFTVGDSSYNAEAGSLRWIVNGNEVTTATGQSLVIDAQNYIRRTYTLTALILENDQWYSGEYSFTVVE
jgi:hypothetical protein